MTAQPVICCSLTCNGDALGEPLVRDDTDDVILSGSVDQLRTWAWQVGWVRYLGGDWCRECTAKLALRDHEFVAGLANDPFCAICGEWPTCDRHHPEILSLIDLHGEIC